MNGYEKLLGKPIKFLAPQMREIEVNGKTTLEFRQGELSGKVERDFPDRRQVQLGPDIDTDRHRYEDVTLLEVEGQPFAQWLAANTQPAPDAPSVVRWNPLMKQVINHETGEVDEAKTADIRKSLGLPAWTPGDLRKPPLYLPAAAPSENQKSEIRNQK